MIIFDPPDLTKVKVPEYTEEVHEIYPIDLPKANCLIHGKVGPLGVAVVCWQCQDAEKKNLAALEQWQEEAVKAFVLMEKHWGAVGKGNFGVQALLDRAKGEGNLFANHSTQPIN